MEMIYTLAEIDEVAIEFINQFGDEKIMAVNGVMGAGKTTFIQAVCRQMGVKEAMSSPTFPIIQQYVAVNNILINHIDVYRLRDEEEAIQAGVQDAVNSGDFCFVEWAEKITNILPLHFISIFIQPANGTQRKLIVKSLGKKS